MINKLLNEKEAAEYLGISQSQLENMVRKKKLSAYKIGGEFLRFDPKELDRFKAVRLNNIPAAKVRVRHPLSNRVKDYLYYNDFYIIVAILILILLALVFKASF